MGNAQQVLLEIDIVTLSGESSKLEVPDSESISQVIARLEAIPHGKVASLAFNGAVLDSQKTLRESNVSSGSSLSLLVTEDKLVVQVFSRCTSNGRYEHGKSGKKIVLNSTPADTVRSVVVDVRKRTESSCPTGIWTSMESLCMALPDGSERCLFEMCRGASKDLSLAECGFNSRNCQLVAKTNTTIAGMVDGKPAGVGANGQPDGSFFNSSIC